MSALMAAFLWCILALFTGAAGAACALAGSWGIGAAFLAFAAVAGVISYRLGKDPT